SQFEKCWGCTAELNPGPYILRLQTEDLGAFEQTIFTCPGWQTQIFLQRRPFTTAKTPSYWPDLADRSILMANFLGHAPGTPLFDAANPALRLTDLARTGLANHPPVLDALTLKASSSPMTGPDAPLDPTLQEMFYGKFTNPMLGLYGCHLLLLTPD